MSRDYSKEEMYCRHGGPYDRGNADAYYHRPGDPHYFLEGTYNSHKVTEHLMTKEQVEAYWQGYEDCDDFKDWG